MTTLLAVLTGGLLLWTQRQLAPGAHPFSAGRMKRWLAYLAPLALLAACATRPLPPPVPVAEGGLDAKNRQDERYFNPWAPHEISLWDFFRALVAADFFADMRAEDVPVLPAPAHRFQTPPTAPAIHWAGHASFAIQEGRDIVLTDPHFSDSALLVNRRTPPGFTAEDLPPPLFAVISHNHYDHLDEDSVLALPADLLWLVPAGLAQWFRDRGRERVQELGWWESVQIGEWTASCVPVQHWSSRIGQPRNSTLWCGWVIESAKHRYFFAGDSGYFPGFAELPRRFGAFDVALLPIGAYRPEWFLGYQHMSPAEAYRSFVDIGARYFIPMHWGTFRLSNESLPEPAEVLRAVIAREGGDASRVPILGIGQRWTLPPRE